ncbi:urotensin-2B [Alligator mississippiensis]|uniref:urotensin-2B n=1 Tax=Alligator mississippiensis TaxID=8496 RepID=UPI002877D3DF|nr:urotensin-2B [Alligator mississippiensis]
MGRIGSAQLCFGMLAVLAIVVYIPSTHGKPFLLQGKLKARPECHLLYVTENQVFPEREDAGHQDALLTLLLDKNPAWRHPANIDLELAKKYEELQQLARLKEQLLADEGSDMAYPLESLAASHPQKRACFWKYCV